SFNCKVWVCGVGVWLQELNPNLTFSRDLFALLVVRNRFSHSKNNPFPRPSLTSSSVTRNYLGDDPLRRA
ncbi:hypothetical protein ACI65C_000163, partial [Semiaphis heraclei]